MARVAIYTRVSTDGQTTENQRLELTAWAERCGHTVVGTYEDQGISGAKGRDKRPGLDRMLKDAVKRKIDMVAAWSVDRLGRSLVDLLGTLSCLKDSSVGLFLHQQGLDTSTSAGNAMFQMLGVFAEFERAIIVERVNAGLARARVRGTKSGRAIGRPAVSDKAVQAARCALEAGSTIRQAAQMAGLSVGKVGQLKREMARPEMDGAD
jgi:DNA invertase Pin-like site-specific DNA recombinase